jgi:asparagine synthase (glutamine-hydrolysing)
MELDSELGLRPLDGRPAPAVYANPSRWQSVHDALSLGKRVARKGAQKLSRGNRPPAGGTVMASKVVEHWRAQPATLAPLGTLGYIRHDWVDSVLAGRVEPRPSSVALLTNLVVAISPTPR